MTVKQQSFFAIAIALLLGVVIYSYLPGLSGIFLLDDRQNLQALNAQGGVTSWSKLLAFVFDNKSGELGRPVSMLSFLINDQYFPGSVESYRFTNLMIHCLAGLGVFVLARKMFIALGQRELGANQLALLAASWWMLSPFNVSTTLYVIQRMTQLSALFIIFGLIAFLKGRNDLARGHSAGYLWIIVGLFGCGTLALLSKENGALIFVYAAACESAIVAARRERSHPFVLLAIVGPILALVAYFVLRWPNIMVSYEIREFSLGDRLVTEARMLVDYLMKGVLPFSGNMGLIHDDWVISRSLVDPWSGLLAVLFHLLVIVAAWFCRFRCPLLLFAAIWFYGGHILESSFIPLELYFEHRNYLPLVGVLMAISSLLWVGFSRKWLGRSGLILLIVAAGLMTHQRAAIWGNPEWQTLVWAAEHPDSLRAQTAYAVHFIAKEEYSNAHEQLKLMRSRWPDAAHIELLIMNHQCRGNFPGPVDWQSIDRVLAQGYYNGYLSAIMTNTVELYRSVSCEWLDKTRLHKLLQGTAELDRAVGVFKARMYYIDSEIYTREGNLGGAMQALELSFQNQIASSIPYSQAMLLHSAGLNTPALEFIDQALMLEQRKPAYRQRNIELYSSLRQSILSAVQ